MEKPCRMDVIIHNRSIIYLVVYLNQHWTFLYCTIIRSNVSGYHHNFFFWRAITSGRVCRRLSALGRWQCWSFKDQTFDCPHRRLQIPHRFQDFVDVSVFCSVQWWNSPHVTGKHLLVNFIHGLMQNSTKRITRKNTHEIFLASFKKN